MEDLYFVFTKQAIEDIENIAAIQSSACNYAVSGVTKSDLARVNSVKIVFLQGENSVDVATNAEQTCAELVKTNNVTEDNIHMVLADTRGGKIYDMAKRKNYNIIPSHHILNIYNKHWGCAVGGS